MLEENLRDRSGSFQPRRTSCALLRYSKTETHQYHELDSSGPHLNLPLSLSLSLPPPFESTTPPLPSPTPLMESLAKSPLPTIPKPSPMIPTTHPFPACKVPLIRSEKKQRSRSRSGSGVATAGAVGSGSDGSDRGPARLLERTALGFAAAAAAAMISVGGGEPPARAESLTVAFPVSRAREV